MRKDTMIWAIALIVPGGFIGLAVYYWLLRDCPHNNYTFPMTFWTGKFAGRTVVQCLDCGERVDYDWANMRIHKYADTPVRAVSRTDWVESLVEKTQG